MERIYAEVINMKKLIWVLKFLLISLLFLSCSATKKPQNSIAVFIPGIIADSPVYQMLAAGVQKAVNTANLSKAADEKIQVTVLEAGTNQAEWSTKLTALAAENKYNVIISSNPSLPDLVDPLTAQFPLQKFILLDATKSENKNIATICYNQHEQSYLTGYIAGLMSKSHKIGLIAAQEYPVLNTIILPGFSEGARAAVPETTVDFRIVGNWYDASKGSELATAQYKAGIDVILPICGGAAQGVINAAKENKIYVTWFDNNGFDKAPGTIISSTVMKQSKMAEQITTDYIAGKIEWGTAKTVGVKDGFIEFVQNDPAYIAAVPQNVRDKMAFVVKQIQCGNLILPQ
jgi:riboflavin transport system substrate-binding protein